MSKLTKINIVSRSDNAHLKSMDLSQVTDIDIWSEAASDTYGDLSPSVLGDTLQDAQGIFTNCTSLTRMKLQIPWEPLSSSVNFKIFSNLIVAGVISVVERHAKNITHPLELSGYQWPLITKITLAPDPLDVVPLCGKHTVNVESTGMVQSSFEGNVSPLDALASRLSTELGCNVYACIPPVYAFSTSSYQLNNILEADKLQLEFKLLSAYTQMEKTVEFLPGRSHIRPVAGLQDCFHDRGSFCSLCSLHDSRNISPDDQATADTAPAPDSFT